MKELIATRPLVLLIAGAIVVGALALWGGPAPTPSVTPMGFWEAAARGFVSVVMVNETFSENGNSVTLPVGIEVTNTASVPVVISEEAVLMSPHPSQSPPPAAHDTTADAVLTTGTVPASGSLRYSFGEYVLAGWLTGPMWWDMEQTQSSQAEVAFHVGGETLPFGLRTLVEHPFFHGLGDNTQTAIYAYLRSYPSVVVGKQPVWSTLNGNAGQTLRIRLDATNMAVWATNDPYTANVNVTHGLIEDDVPTGWTAGSYSVPPDTNVTNADGSHTLKWVVALPAAQVVTNPNPNLPTPYTTATRFYTLLSPSLGAGNVSLPRAQSDMNNTGTADAHSAPVVVFVPPNPPAIADAGGPYTGHEGDTILLNASASRDPDGDQLQFRWSFTDNGTWDTAWSSEPTASVTYTDEFSGQARVEISDGHTTVNAAASVTITNVPPTIHALTVSVTASAEFRLIVAGEKGHDVTFVLDANGTTLAKLRVVRKPGDPEHQSQATGMLTINQTRPVTAWVLYTPSDDPVNGQPNGDNPAWLVVTYPNGTSLTLFHNFNVRHRDTWNWSLGSLAAVFPRHAVTLSAHLFDPGADALTARWDFGDGTNVTQVFANGPAGDAPESPVGGTSMDLFASVVHVYPAGGPFTASLTVTDADGAMASGSVTVPAF